MKQEFKELPKLLELQWTQGTFARDAAGKSVDVLDPSAVSFCIEGGLHKIVMAGNPGYESMNLLYGMNRAVEAFIPDGHIPSWNDAKGRTLDEVLGVVDRCIEAVD